MQRPAKAVLLKELRELAIFVDAGEIVIERDPGGEPCPLELEAIASMEEELLKADMAAFFSGVADAETVAGVRAEVGSWPEVERTEFYLPNDVPELHLQPTPPGFNGCLAIWVADPARVSAVAEQVSSMISPTKIQGITYGDTIAQLDAVASWLNEATSHAHPTSDAAEEWLRRAPYWQCWITSV